MSKNQRHRGRFQAQGGGLEASESWNQSEPITKKKGLSLLDRLRKKLKPEDQKLRKKQFEDAGRFIKGVNGGLDAPLKQTFQNRKTKDVRVDIEILSGTAFVSCVLLILILLWLLLH